MVIVVTCVSWVSRLFVEIKIIVETIFCGVVWGQSYIINENVIKLAGKFIF